MTLRPRLVRALRALLAAAGAMATAAAPADAAIYYVGPPGDHACDFTDVQAAIDHAQTVPGHDVIRLVTAHGYLDQALVIDDDGGLSLVGGYGHCADGSISSGTRTVLSGAGGSSAPIVAVRGSGTVKLHFVQLWGNADGLGLDVNCEGCTVQLLEVTIDHNAQGVSVATASCGGNCAAPARLIVNDNVEISGNLCWGERACSGAGISVRSAILDMSRAPGSRVSGNLAEGDGGGVLLAFQASGLIGAAVVGNTARGHGGGVAVTSGSTLLLYPTSLLSMPRLANNQAGGRGGALYVQNSYFAPRTSVLGWDAALEGNSAEEGGAAYVSSVAADPVRLCLRSLASPPAPDGPCPERAPAGAVPCPASMGCNGIRDNRARYQGAAVMAWGSRAHVHVAHQTVTSNEGWSVIGHDALHAAKNESTVRIDDSLLAQNRPRHATVLNRFTLRTTVRRSTVADNERPAFELDEAPGFELADSIIWEPGEPSLIRWGTPGTDLVRMVLASEVDSFGSAADVRAAPDPGFLSAGDYRLRENSPAVDFSDSVFGLRDLAGNPRGVDLPGVFDLFGPADVGAFERQPVPIVTSP